MRRRYKNASGKLLTKGLFYEEADWETRDKTAIYTLRDEDWTTKEGTTYPSLYRLYIEEADLAEWDFANKYLYSFKHWQALCQSGFFKEYVARWRTDLETKLKSQAMKEIQAEAFSGGKSAFAALKWIVDKGWAPEVGHSRGRPSKQEIKEAAHRVAVDTTQVDADFNRLSDLPN